ncbi:MAG: N-acetylmuramic acid 6-phosphate etherase [Christensenellales bacterium]|jgi:N-acetylmuramic acid 6-phosphate etherase
MQFDRLQTEQVHPDSLALDTLTPLEAAALMNQIDRAAAEAVEQALPAIAQAVEGVAARLKAGGRLIYMGAGTSGRLGVLDASECPPTFGVDGNLVVGLIAGGDRALRHATENAEDKPELGENDLRDIGLTAKDCVVGISASGYAPYCVGALDYARSQGALTIAMSCNTGATLSQHADIAIEMPTGPEILSGSTRLKAGTATKMALNMISTLTMVQMGKVYGNLMVDMKPSNNKLKDRAIRIVQNALHIERPKAEALYEAAGQNVKTAIVMHETGAPADAARQALDAHQGFVRRAVQALRK